MPETTKPYELALDVFAATPGSLSALLEPLAPAVWEWSPAPGEWTPYETLAHMLHVETAVIPVRVRQMLVEDGAALVVPPESAAPASPEETLRAWREAREASLAFLRAITPAQLDRSGIHPRFGRITAREHIIEWAYHDLEHLRQLQATIEAYLYPSIGGFRTLYTSPYPGDEQSY
jgi:hypothetical protein